MTTNDEIIKKYNKEDYHGRCDKKECFICDLNFMLNEAREDERKLLEKASAKFDTPPPSKK